MSADTFGHWVMDRRKQLQLSRVALAERIGCATVSLQKIELDERRPSEQLAARLADQLQIDPQQRQQFVRVARGELPITRLHQPNRETQPLIPKPLGTLYGRAEDSTELRELLMLPVRLLTITGPGGVGKTRMALHLADTMQTSYPGGVRIVDLAPLSVAEQVLGAIAQAFGVVETVDVPLLNRLAHHVREQQILLVLDNFEHVLDAAPTISQLLQLAPQLTLVVTSRVVLRISDEHEYQLPPLALPPIAPSSPTTPALPQQYSAIPSQYAAIELFLARAQAIHHQFRLTSENTSIITAICRRLDGLPLALELAAARLKLFTPATLLERLEHSLSILQAHQRDRPNRQHTLRATLDWSYRLLSAQQQRLLWRLAVFSGGWTLAAAEVVCADALLPDKTIAEHLQGLLDQSMVQPMANSVGELRFMMLETVREYALERLIASSEEPQMREQHASWALAYAETMDRVFSPTWQANYIELLTQEHANFRTALAWYSHQPDPEPGLRLAGAMHWLWAWYGYRSEARQWLSIFLPRSQAFSLGLAKACICAGDLFGGHGDELLETSGMVYLETSLASFRDIGNTHGSAIALLYLGRTTWFLGQYTDSERYFNESLALCRTNEYRWGICWALLSLGNTLLDLGKYAAANTVLHESVECSQTWGYIEIESWAIHNLGRVAHSQGDDQQALAYYHAARPLFRARKATQGIGESLLDEGRIAHSLGDAHKACMLYRESYQYADMLGSPRSYALWLEAIAGIAASQGQPSFAIRLFAMAIAFRTASSFTHTIYEEIDHQRDLAIATALLPKAQYQATWDAGHALPMQQALAEAWQFLNTIEPTTTAADLALVMPQLTAQPPAERLRSDQVEH